MSVRTHTQDCAKSLAVAHPEARDVDCTCAATYEPGAAPMSERLEVRTHAEADDLGPGFYWVLTDAGEEVVEIVNDEADEPMIFDTARNGWVRIADIPDGTIRGWAGPIPEPDWEAKFPETDEDEGPDEAAVRWAEGAAARIVAWANKGGDDA